MRSRYKNKASTKAPKDLQENLDAEFGEEELGYAGRDRLFYGKVCSFA